MTRRFLLPIVLVVFLVAGVRSQRGEPTAAATPAPATGDKGALFKLEQDWGDAVVRHDTAFLERVEADSYVYTDATGCVGHKADDLASAKAADLKIESFKLSDMKAQLHGDTAVVTGQTTLAGRDHGGPLNGTYRWTDVFVRKAGGDWQVVASQATEVNRPETAIVLPAETPAGEPADSDD